MDPRMKERRRGVARAHGRRRLVVALALLLGLAGAAGFTWVRSSDVFAVRKVSVPLTHRVSPEDLRSAVGEAAGVNLLRVSTDSLEARLRSIPYVRAAYVYRRFPDSLDVEIVEYVPVARIVGKDGADWLLAEDGTVLEEWKAEGDPAGAALPLFAPETEVWPQPGMVTAPQVVEALALAGRLSDEGLWPVHDHPVERVLVHGSGDVTMVLRGGGEVRLGGASQLDEKLMVALEIVDRYVEDRKSLEYVDVRVPASAVAKAK